MLKRIRLWFKKADQGFTLIELVVVAVILGLLAAIVIPKFVGQKEVAENSRIAADLKIIQNAVDLQFAEIGTYALNPEALVTAGYLKEEPADPKIETPDDFEYFIDETTHKAMYAVMPTP